MFRIFQTGSRWSTCLIAMAVLFTTSEFASAQRGVPTLKIQDDTTNIVVYAGSHYLLDFKYRIPDLWVGNTVFVNAQPIGPNKVMISGFEPGVTTLTVSDENRAMQALTVHVLNDVRDVQSALDIHFPGSLIKAHPLNEGVVLRGVVSSNQDFSRANEIATKYYDSVLNHLQVDGAQMVAISVKVYEVSRTKLRELGVDWSFFGDQFSAVQSVSGLIQNVGGASTGSGQSLSFGVIDDSSRFNAFINALEQRSLAKLLDEPTLVAENGRAAEFLSGGEIPIQISNNFGASSIEYRQFGTKLDIVPIIHDRGSMTLEVKAEVSDIAGDLSTGGSPGFRVRRVNTGVRMKTGQTLALAGDYREEVETIVRGIPKLMDAPFLGPLFRDTRERKNETELVFLITPKFIEATDKNPGRLPGRISKIPSDFELYRHGTLEVTSNDPVQQTVGSPYSGGSGNAASRDWGHVQGYSESGIGTQGAPSYSQPQDYGYQMNSTPNSLPAGTAAPTYQPGYVPNEVPPNGSGGVQDTFSDRTLRPISTPSGGVQSQLLDSATPPDVNVPAQWPPAPPVSEIPVQPSEKLKADPTKNLKLSNPFENRQTTPPTIEGPFGFSK